jgi:hypothetical protein
VFWKLDLLHARRGLLRGAFTGGLCLSLVALCGLLRVSAARADARVTGAVRLATPGSTGPPALAVDRSGTGYIAWAVRKDLTGGDDHIQYCVLPAHANGCSATGTLVLADAASYVAALQVLLDRNTVLIIADVYKGSAPITEDYYPVQEWKSTDRGRSFTIVNKGHSVISGGDYDHNQIPLNAVVLPGDSALGYGWLNPAASPAFAAVPLASGSECSQSLTVALCPFATLGPIPNNEPTTLLRGQVASQPGPKPSVVVIYSTQASDGPLACTPAYAGLAFAYGTGAQSATNDYNLSPGSPHSAWNTAITHIACNVQDAAVAGGARGLGVIDYNTRTADTVYRRFDPVHEHFTAPHTIATGSRLASENSTSLTQDSHGTIYATYLLGIDQTAVLSYSRDGGKHWIGPISINDGDQGEVYPTSTVSPRGHGLAVWLYQNSVYARRFTH